MRVITFYSIMKKLFNGLILSMGHPTRKQVALVESCFIEILGKVAVKDMKRVIDSQTDDVKYWLFRLYLTYLSSLQAEIKSLSN